MKILVLNGSPKRDKSDTMRITRAFLDGMKGAAPQDIHIIHVLYGLLCLHAKRRHLHP